MDKKYSIESTLGEGGYGTVYAGTRMKDAKLVAVKKIDKKKVLKWHEEMIPMEIHIMIKLANSNVNGIMKLIEYFETSECYYIIMERLENVMDLFEFTEKNGVLSEDIVKYFLRQIVSTIMEIQEVGVFERDIKDENILVDLKTYKLYLIDFGCAVVETKCTNFGGATVVYSPPECFTNDYDVRPAIIWSIGILVYNMLFGEVPFQNLQSILEHKLSFPKTFVSEEVKDLIQKCLSGDPKDRPTLKEIKSHAWLTQ